VTLTCRQLVELVSDYLGHVLPPDDRVRFEQHLLVCPPCTLHLGQVRATIALAAELRDLPPGEPVADPVADPGPALLDAFRRRKQP
jgi:hypothetical protein